MARCTCHRGCPGHLGLAHPASGPARCLGCPRSRCMLPPLPRRRHLKKQRADMTDVCSSAKGRRAEALDWVQDLSATLGPIDLQNLTQHTHIDLTLLTLLGVFQATPQCRDRMVLPRSDVHHNDAHLQLAMG